ncbi:MAG: helix-turn-helix transcriptional regulator [Treponema sp.]|nr:helix-turn-helix transcriptional regulator [Treponema sp.]
MGIRETFRENLKHYRKARGLSQEKLSELIGFGETYITEIESRHKFPKPETIDVLAEHLKIEAYEFFMPIKQQKDIENIQEMKKKEEFTQKLCLMKSKIDELFNSQILN